MLLAYSTCSVFDTMNVEKFLQVSPKYKRTKVISVVGVTNVAIYNFERKKKN